VRDALLSFSDVALNVLADEILKRHRSCSSFRHGGAKVREVCFHPFDGCSTPVDCIDCCILDIVIIVIGAVVKVVPSVVARRLQRDR
jgi:hypothetical protein